MKMVVTGKGGAGKTTVAAILARTIARSGLPVLALDADPNPNLALALGLGRERAAAVDSALNAIVRERSGGVSGAGMASDPPPLEGVESLVRRLMVEAPDGVRLLQTGRIERPADGCLCCGSHFASRRLFREITLPGGVVIADLEPGVNDLIWVEPQPDDAVIVVTQPYRKSLEVTTRTLQVARDFGARRIVVVANRLNGPDDADLVREWLPDVDVEELPDDPAVARAGACGDDVVHAAAGAPVVHVLAALGSRLTAHLDRQGVGRPAAQRS